MRSFSISKLRYLVLPVAVCLSLTACGTKNYQPEEDSYVSTDDSLYENYILSVDEETGPLLDTEKKAFLSVSEIDRNITAEQLKCIEKEYKHYIKNPRGRVTIERFMYRAMPYLDFTKKVFREKNMPEELAYLAFVESGYHPFARSSANALGMWQFMAPTARHCGLAVNWWIDERLDPYKATYAAADYLQEMYDEFNDWYLALAAYNAGPGKIRRALTETGTDNFFDLMEANETINNSKIKIKKETADYVPRFIAMAKIIRNFDSLGFEPKANELGKGHNVIKEQAVAIKAQRGSDLKAIAREMNISWQTFRDYNPAFLQTVTPLSADTVFYVPASLQAKGLEVSRMEMLAGWSTYTIRKGDTLSGISKKTGVPVHVLRQANAVSEPLRIGQHLRLPGHNTYMADKNAGKSSGFGTRPEKDFDYTVKSGDTFGKIANNHGLALAELQKANPQIKDVTKLALGQQIHIPGTKQNFKVKEQKPVQNLIAANKTKQIQQTASKKQESAPASSPKILKSRYTIQKGDTLYSVAQKHGLTVAELQKMNNGLSPQNLAIGQSILVKAHENYIASSSKEAPRQNLAKKKTYTVKQGDTLYSIAKSHGLSVAELQTHNKNLSTSISIGQKIVIPSKTQLAAAKPIVHIVKKGETLYSISKNYNVTVDAIVAYNNLADNSLSIGQKVKIPNTNYTMASADNSENIQ
ncbi:MAG: LysM peptidoglycan-binding domain-containing protein [Mailhella sp.]|nr:LysM peptidoglycan-binding domain-containing protein [Mailhella sp.]